jgi:hypothetical protein
LAVLPTTSVSVALPDVSGPTHALAVACYDALNNLGNQANLTITRSWQ